mgnify:CR=1 FL=1
MKIYQFDNYKAFLTDAIENMPKKGRGIARKLAEYLTVHPTMISQVLNGPKHLSQEQGYKTCEFLVLGEDEARYFINLLSFEKAGTVNLKEFYRKQLKEQKDKAKKVSSHVAEVTQISDKEAAIFYSQWKYSAIRLLTSLPEIRTRQDVAKYLGLSNIEVSRMVDELLKSGLCVEKKNELAMGAKLTHITPDSPYLPNHHANWRLRSIDQCSSARKDDLFITAPMTLSLEDFEKIRMRLLQLIKEISRTVEKSESELLACFNIDLFKLTPSGQGH